MREHESALLTDLYELTMLQAYHDEALRDTAVFELFVRKLPPERNFLMFAGTPQVLDYLENLAFSADELAWLRTCGRLRPDFVDSLADFRFTGSVHALREGTVFFANEPVLRIEAPIGEAQLVESRLINLVNFSTLIASKAARCVLAGGQKTLVDFGMRRAHGAEAALLAARASYLAGFAGTATVLAGQRFGVPVFGTMAHAYIEAHDLEADAFTGFGTSHPDKVTLLIDTYDTEAAAEKIVALAPSLLARGITLGAVRLDSGDLGEHARRVREILDRGGLQHVRILASGNLDEHKIAHLIATGAPIDGFGIGTSLTTSADAPTLDSAYKLQSYAGKPRRKRSEGKANWPGAKQIVRVSASDGRFDHDRVMLDSEFSSGSAAEALLHPVMRDGRRLASDAPLEVVRQHAAEQLTRLPCALRALSPVPDTQVYRVDISEHLQRLAAELDRQPH